MMRYIQTGTVIDENNVTFDSFFKTEFEVQGPKIFKKFMEDFEKVHFFKINNIPMVLYTNSGEEEYKKIIDLFKVYAKHASSKKDEYGVYGNVINLGLKEETSKDFWFCFEGAQAPWFVIKEEKETAFLKYVRTVVFKDESPIILEDNSIMNNLFFGSPRTTMVSGITEDIENIEYQKPSFFSSVLTFIKNILKF